MHTGLNQPQEADARLYRALRRILSKVRSYQQQRLAAEIKQPVERRAGEAAPRDIHGVEACLTVAVLAMVPGRHARGRAPDVCGQLASAGVGAIRGRQRLLADAALPFGCEKIPHFV